MVHHTLVNMLRSLLTPLKKKKPPAFIINFEFSSSVGSQNLKFMDNLLI